MVHWKPTPAVNTEGGKNEAMWIVDTMKVASFGWLTSGLGECGPVYWFAGF